MTASDNASECWLSWPSALYQWLGSCSPAANGSNTSKPNDSTTRRATSFTTPICTPPIGSTHALSQAHALGARPAEGELLRKGGLL